MLPQTPPQLGVATLPNQQSLAVAQAPQSQISSVGTLGNKQPISQTPQTSSNEKAFNVADQILHARDDYSSGNGGLSDDDIVNQIVQQNAGSSVAQNLTQAQKDGVDSSDILDEFIKQNTGQTVQQIADQKQAIENIQKYGTSSPGFMDKLASTLSNLGEGVLQPFARLGVSAYNDVMAPINAVGAGMNGGNAEQAFSNTLNQPRNIGFNSGAVSPYLGDPTSNEDALRGGLSALGGAAQIGSNFFGVGGATGLAKDVGEQGVLSSIAQGAKTGLAAGGLQGLGTGLQDPNASVGSVIGNTAMSAGMGGVIGGTLGGVGGMFANKVNPISEGYNALKDELATDNFSSAQAFKKANPDLVNSWETNQQTPYKVGQDITADFQKYKSDGITQLQGVKKGLPNVALPETNIKGGINDIISNYDDANTTVEDDRMISKLQNYIKKNVGNDTSVKGLLDLNTGIYKAGYYNADGSIGDKVVNDVTNYIKTTVVGRLENYDTEYGTTYATQVKQGLADAQDKINFQNTFKANILKGLDSKTNIGDATAGKINQLINKAEDPQQAIGTKNLLSEFENRIGQPEKYTKQIEAANTVRTLAKGKVNLTKNLFKGVGFGLGGSLAARLFLPHGTTAELSSTPPILNP